MDKTIIVVDTQYDFMDPNGSLYIGKEAEGLVDKLRRYLFERKSAYSSYPGIERTKVVHTLDWHDYDDAEFIKYPCHCIKYTQGAATVLHKDSIRFIDSFIEKDSYTTSALCSGDGNTAVEIVGVCTHLCVAHIAMTIYNYLRECKPTKMPDITIYRDLVGDFDPVAAEQMLTRLKEDCGVKIETYFKETK